jgi:hypothetical protein
MRVPTALTFRSLGTTLQPYFLLTYPLNLFNLPNLLNLPHHNLTLALPSLHSLPE